MSGRDDAGLERAGGPVASPAPGGERLEAELVRAAAEAAGFAAVALVRVDADGASIAASWPDDWTGLELPAPGSAIDRAVASGRTASSASLDGVPGRLLGATGGPAGVVAAPVRAGGAVVGALCAVGREAPQELEEGRRTLLETFASLAGSRIELEAERRAANDARARMAGLVETGIALAGELGPDELLDRILQSARQLLGARHAALAIWDEGGGLARFVTAGLADPPAAGGDPAPEDDVFALLLEAGPPRPAAIARDAAAAGLGAAGGSVESFLGVPVTLRRAVIGHLYLADKVAGPFTAVDEQIALMLAAQAAVAIDNARRYEGERRRVEELESVQELARSVLATLDLDALLPLVARRARQLTRADTVGVALADGDELVFRHAHGARALGLEGRRGPLDPAALAAELAAEPGAAAVEVVRLEVDGEPAGAIAAIGPRPFDEGARRLLGTFSSHVAIALSNARAVAAERERLLTSAVVQSAQARERAVAEMLQRTIDAQEAERARIARELHDETGQVLTALALHLRVTEELVPDAEARARLVDLRRQVNAAASSLRELTTELRPSGLREHGLGAAIRRQAERVAGASGITFDVSVDGLPEDLPEQVQIALFRVVQEALTNVARHSGAGSASVVATAHAGRVRVVIEDDGRGFDPAAPTERLGLAGIRERVELLGGRLRIESAPGAGTAVVVEVEVGASAPSTP